jgi:hypothetical protein
MCLFSYDQEKKMKASTQSSTLTQKALQFTVQTELL